MNSKVSNNGLEDNFQLYQASDLVLLQD